MKDVLKNNDGSALLTTLGIVAGVSLISLVIPLLWVRFDLPTVELPDTIVNAISSVNYLFYVAGYFLPVGFIFSCILIVLVTRHANVLFDFFNYVYDRLRGK